MGVFRHVASVLRRVFGCFVSEDHGDGHPSPRDLSPQPTRLPVPACPPIPTVLPAQNESSADVTTPTTSVENNSLLVPTPRSRSRRSSFSSRQVQTDPDNDQRSTLASQLQEALIKAYKTVRRRDGTEAPFKFVPISALKRLVSLDTVRGTIEQLGLVEQDQVDSTASLIVKKALRLFAILVILEKEADIFSFLRQDIDDSHLPLVRATTSTGAVTDVFLTRHGKGIDFPPRWDQECFDKFESKQARMLVPVFRRREYRIFVGTENPPFIEWEEDGAAVGSFSEVFKARIHPDHHEFDGHLRCEAAGPLVAVKKLIKDDDEAFEVERRIHQHLSPKDQHPHFVTLLCTYKRSNRYHMVFPWADGTLRGYWADNAVPTLDQDTMLWNLGQMAGIANGLSWLHSIVRADGNPDLYGRHGDLKADNILYFATPPGCEDPGCAAPRGVLQITDLGLARVHTYGSRSNEDPRNVICPSTYAPPDGFRQVKISRKWDIWSLGCMYLEWVTWLLRGYAAVHEFGEARGEPVNQAFSTDHFFSPDHHSVQDAVYEWVEDLHQDPRCSQMLHDLLNLIMSHMILIEPTERLSAEDILKRLDAMLAQSKADSGYLLTPVCCPNRRVRRPTPPQRPPRLPEFYTSMGFMDGVLPLSSHTPNRTDTWPQHR